MKIITAFDSFKDCSEAGEICRIFAGGWHSRRPDDRIAAIPLSDGGEGFTAAAARMLKAEVSSVTVPGPAGENTEAAFAVSGSTACTDMAQAAGLELVPCGKRNALTATSYGFGLLLRHIASLGVREIVCGLGGSATSDGGIGCAQALGWRFFDRDGRLIPPGGGAADCGRAASMVPPDEKFIPRVRAACDVTNPLCGPRGAAMVYSPQKGATAEEAAAIDGFLGGWAALWRDRGEKPGDGAAGGMGFFLRKGLGAELLPGARLLLEMADFDKEARDADLIVTGEGSSDSQTLSGKLPFIVAGEAAARHIPCVLLSGRIADYGLLREHFTAVWSLAAGPCTLEDAIKNTPENLFRAGANLAGMIWK